MHARRAYSRNSSPGYRSPWRILHLVGEAISVLITIAHLNPSSIWSHNVGRANEWQCPPTFLTEISVAGGGRVVERDIHRRLQRARQWFAIVLCHHLSFSLMTVSFPCTTSSGDENSNQQKKSCKNIIFHHIVITY